MNLEVQAGECLVVSGPSGSGKSLLLKAIADIIPHTGEVFLDDSACSLMLAPQWRKQVGLLQAESQWWCDLIGEHFAPSPVVALESLGLAPAAREWGVARCSTGEKQRLALLRLLQNQPKALLLDEPTAALDKDSVRRVESLVKDYARENRAAVIWVSHDPQQIERIADRHFAIEDNRLSEVR